MTGIFYPFVSCLLNTKTGQHSLPRLYMISGTPPRFTQLSWWSPAIDPKDAWLPNPNEIFPNLQEEPSIHPQNEVNALLHPYWRNVWLQNPDEIFPNLQKEFCMHPPAKVIPYCTHIGGMLSLRHCTPYQQSKSSPQLPIASHIGPREYASPAPKRYLSPFPLFHWPALNLPNTNGCQVALCLLMSYATWTLPCHINIR